MKPNIFIMACMLAAATASEAQTAYKVDINEWSRTNMDEVLEPGFFPWRFEKDTQSSTLAMDDGVVFTIRSEQNMRGGWNKAFVQKRDYNSRLTGDGVNLDPNECGTIELVISGLAPGTHTIQTFHNGWADPSNTVGWPITVTLNGQVVQHSVPRTLRVGAMQEAAAVMTTFTVASADEQVVIGISTSDDDAPADAGSKKNSDKTPLLNGFMIDVANSAEQARLPVPANLDMHVDADDGSFLLQWTPSKPDIKTHRLCFGTDSTEVALSTSYIYEGGDTCFTVSDLYSLNKYYWRVDEVADDGTAATGSVWQFRPRHLAFPRAEGYGRYATGGRGGIVYHVTNLSNDNEPGSLLYGLVGLKEPRTIVFDVSGIIDLDFVARFTSNVTIAAQTAPGKGICLMHSNLNVGSESICRHLRARRGYGQTGNALGVTGADHTIIDHTTMSWGTDETFSSRGAKNVTLQYSIISEALGIADHKNYEPGKNHGFAATIGGEIGTFSHNLLANCSGRNWSMGGGLDGDGKAAGSLDMMNNVVYNWHSRTTDGGAKWMHFVNNYYKMGPDTKNSVLFTAQNELGGHRAQFAYVSGNVRENKNGTLTYDQKGVTYNATGDYPEETWVDQPFFPSYATLHTAEQAFRVVTSDVGATQPTQDDTDRRVIHETITGTYTYVGSRSGIKGEIDHEDDAGGFELYPEETRPQGFDTDQDGMPDWWERIVGSDPQTDDHNDDPDHDGYTLLEDYLNFLAVEHRVVAPGTQTSIDLNILFAGFVGHPSYSVAVEGSAATATLNGSMLDVKASDGHGLCLVDLAVADATGFEHHRMLAIAVSGEGEQLAVKSLSTDDIVAYQLYDLAGRKIHGEPLPDTVYVMKAVDREGRSHTVKVIKR